MKNQTGVLGKGTKYQIETADGKLSSQITLESDTEVEILYLTNGGEYNFYQLNNTPIFVRPEDEVTPKEYEQIS